MNSDHHLSFVHSTLDIALGRTSDYHRPYTKLYFLERSKEVKSSMLSITIYNAFQSKMY